MDPIKVFSTKAEKYARYRWDYAPEAIQALFDVAGLSAASWVADLGAGTGIFTRHFAGRVARVAAVEPNDEMRLQAERALAGLPGCVVSGARAEATGLPARSFDLASVAQAIHWFQPEPARDEFRRILKPGGWLALLRNYGTEKALEAATGRLATVEYGASFHQGPDKPEPKPAEYYYAASGCQRLLFPFINHIPWETFFGAMLSASFMPDESHPCFPALERAAREVFEQFSASGVLEVRGETELIIGRVSSNPQA